MTTKKIGSAIEAATRLMAGVDLHPNSLLWKKYKTHPILSREVFVTPGKPIVTHDRPPGIQETYFQPTAATLIYGTRDAVLVDAFMMIEQANALFLADWVATKGKILTTIYITHGHGDHWFGVGTLLERFPNARAVATLSTVKMMHQNASPRPRSIGLEPRISGSDSGQARDRGRARRKCD